MPLILFSSPKGGVGKTTLAAYTASILMQRGFSVLALDLDPQNALRLHLGSSVREERGFMACIDERADWRAATLDTPSGVRLLPFGSVEPQRAMQLEAVLLDEPELLTTPLREMLSEPSVVVVVDTPPGPLAVVAAVTPFADLTVIVLLADAGSVALLPQITAIYGRGTLAARRADRMVVMLNQVNRGGTLSSAVLDSTVLALGSRLIGAICRDEALAEALANRTLLTEVPGGAAEDLALMVDAIQLRAKLVLPSGRRGNVSALAD